MSDNHYTQPSDNVYTDISPNPPPFDDFAPYLHEAAAEVEPPSSLTTVQNESEAKTPLFIWANELSNIPPVEYFDLPRTHHQIPKRKLTLLYGLSGSCKSFLALDCALKIGQSLPVLYVAGEGIDGYNARVGAWRATNGGHLQNIAFWNTAEHNAPQFCEPEQLATILDVAQQIKEARGQPVALIVVDTLARVIVGKEENSNAEMGMMVDACEYLIRETGAAVVLVHHTDKRGEVPRGAGAVLNAVQSSLSVVRDMRQNLITVTCAKSKDTGDDDPRNGQIGRYYNVMPAANSIVLAPVNHVIPEKETITPRERDMLEALAENNKPLTRRAWWECCDNEPGKDWAKERGNFSAYIRKLKRNNLIEETEEEPRVSTITDAGRATIKPRLVKVGAA